MERILGKAAFKEINFGIPGLRENKVVTNVHQYFHLTYASHNIA
jgi:hypothetical protein